MPRHAFHLPLAVNTARLKEQLGISSEGGLLRPDTYMHDISFVGSLYESSHYSSFRYAPNHLRGYLAGIIAAQKEVWGIDLISPVLTPGRLAEFTAFMPYSGAEYEMLTAKEVFCSIIQKEVTSTGTDRSREPSGGLPFRLPSTPVPTPHAVRMFSRRERYPTPQKCRMFSTDQGST